MSPGPAAACPNTERCGMIRRVLPCEACCGWCCTQPRSIARLHSGAGGFPVGPAGRRRSGAMKGGRRQSPLRLCAFRLEFRSMATTVKRAAVRWLVSKFGDTGNTVRASKLYFDKRTQRSFWWLEIPQQALEEPLSNEIVLLCEVAPGANKFYCLKVPVKFFKTEKERRTLCVRKNGKLSFYLSAEPEEMFVEQRGEGKVHFHHFLQTI